MAKRPACTPEAVALSRLIQAVFQMNGRLFRSGDSLTRDLGLTAARWQVLGAVAERRRTVPEIARRFYSTRQGVLKLVTAMVKDGLLELVDNPEHKRAKFVQFTERGREVYKELSRRQVRRLNQIAADHARAELDQASDVLARLARDFS